MQISKFCDLGYLTFAYPAALIKNGGILFRNTVLKQTSKKNFIAETTSI